MKGNFSFWTHLSYLVHGQSSATSAPAQDITLPTKRWVPDVLMCCVAPVTRCWPECPLEPREEQRATIEFLKDCQLKSSGTNWFTNIAVRRFDSWRTKAENQEMSSALALCKIVCYGNLHFHYWFTFRISLNPITKWQSVMEFPRIWHPGTTSPKVFDAEP